MILFSYLVWSTTALFEQDKPNDNFKGFVTSHGNKNALAENLSGYFEQGSQKIF